MTAENARKLTDAELAEVVRQAEAAEDQYLLALAAEVLALRAKVAALTEAGDEMANFWPGHTHGMMGKGESHRCERCDHVAAWTAAKGSADADTRGKEKA